MKVFELLFCESTFYQSEILPNYNDCDTNALKLFHDYMEKYARRAFLHVYVTANRNFIIRFGETLLKYICTKNSEDLSWRHEDNC